MNDINEWQAREIALSVNNLYDALREKDFSHEFINNFLISYFKGAAND